MTNPSFDIFNEIKLNKKFTILTNMQIHTLDVRLGMLFELFVLILYSVHDKGYVCPICPHDKHTRKFITFT